MTLRLVAPPWSGQPNEEARVDWSNPLTASLLGITCGGQGERAGGGLPLYSGSFALQPGPGGLGPTYVGVGSMPGFCASLLDRPRSYTGDYTVMVFASGSGTAGSVESNRFEITPAGSATTTDLRLGGTSATFVIDNNPSSALAGDYTKPTVFVGTRVGNQASAYTDGAFRQSWTTGTRNGSLTGLLAGRRSGNNAAAITTYMMAVWDRALSAAEILSLGNNPWQLFEPQQIWVIADAGGGGAHDASGNLAASAAVVVGAASRSASHAASGALAAGSAAVAGSANRVIVHAATGALTATAAAVAGLATRYRTHASAGGLVSSAAVIAGLADVTQVGPSHAAVGDLVAGNAAVSGTANRYKVHAGSGALQADAAVLAGVAAHNVLHAASGALVAGEAAVAGVAFIGDEPPVVSRLGGFEMGAPEIERKPLLQQILEARAARSAPVAKPAKKKAKAIEIQAAHAVLADRGESQFTALMKQWAAQKPVLSPIVDTTAEAFMAQVKARILEIEQDDEDVLMLLLD